MPRLDQCFTLRGEEPKEPFMGSKKSLKAFGALFVIIFTSSCSFDDRIVGTAEATIEDELLASITRLFFEHGNLGDKGQLDVVCEERDTIGVTVQFRARTTYNAAVEQEILDNFTRELRPRDRERYPGYADLIVDVEQGGYYVSDTTLTLPERLVVDITDHRGDFTFDGCSGLNLEDDSGDVLIQNVEGPINISFDDEGDIEILNTRGNVEIDDDSGHIVVEFDDSDVDPNNSDVHPPPQLIWTTEITDRSGDIIVRSRGGTAVGPVEIWDEEGDISVRNGDLSVCTRHYGDIDAPNGYRIIEGCPY